MEKIFFLNYKILKILAFFGKFFFFNYYYKNENFVILLKFIFIKNIKILAFLEKIFFIRNKIFHFFFINFFF
ncbi:MAG: hypothetical protein B6I24_01335 [Bacteroidetes bacterium 4572_128]|nr:MAG: hypothetical protein B6I24_01335 [Bacteroidetes bacterium 4572_128]